MGVIDSLEYAWMAYKVLQIELLCFLRSIGRSLKNLLEHMVFQPVTLSPGEAPLPSRWRAGWRVFTLFGDTALISGMRASAHSLISVSLFLFFYICKLNLIS